jgi:hypothetical protein
MHPLTTALSASVLTALALAQEPERVQAKPPSPQVAAPAPARAVPGHGFVLEAGDLSIDELIDSAAQFLNRNILYLPAEVQSGPKGAAVSVHLQNRLELDANGCEEMLCTLLYSRGFALTLLDPGRNLYEVIHMAGPRAKEISARAVYMTPDEILRRPQLRMAVLTTVELQNINTPVAVNALRPFFGQSGPQGGALQLGNVGNSGGLILQGFADQVAAAIRLVRECDKPLPPDRPPELVTRVQQLEQQVQSLREQLAKKADKPETKG